MSRRELRQMKKTLSRQWWAGIGALAAIVVIPLAIYEVAKGDDGPKLGGDGDSNCNINGSGNTCQGAPPPVKETEDSIEVSDPTWPMLPECDGATSVAAMPWNGAASSVKLSPATDVRETLTAQRAAAYGYGFVTLNIGAKTGTTIQILGIKPLFYTTKKIDPVWVYDPMGGCGDSYVRILDVDLDKRTSKDRGTSGGGDVGAEPGSHVKSVPFGPKFHVTHDDPAAVTVNATGCSGYHEWGIQITYAVGGKTYKKVVGTADHPFRVVGKPSRPIPLYSEGSDDQEALSQVESSDGPTGCR
jgi:hypothetical protein